MKQTLCDACRERRDSADPGWVEIYVLTGHNTGTKDFCGLRCAAVYFLRAAAPFAPDLTRAIAHIDEAVQVRR